MFFIFNQVISAGAERRLAAGSAARLNVAQGSPLTSPAYYLVKASPRRIIYQPFPRLTMTPLLAASDSQHCRESTAACMRGRRPRFPGAAPEQHSLVCGTREWAQCSGFDTTAAETWLDAVAWKRCCCASCRVFECVTVVWEELLFYHLPGTDVISVFPGTSSTFWRLQWCTCPAGLCCNKAVFSIESVFYYMKEWSLF